MSKLWGRCVDIVVSMASWGDPENIVTSRDREMPGAVLRKQGLAQIKIDVIFDDFDRF